MRTDRLSRLSLVLAILLTAAACADHAAPTAPQDDRLALTDAVSLPVTAAAKPIKPPPAPIYIADFDLSSNKVPLSLDGTPYTVLVRNTTGVSQSQILVQGILEQGGQQFGAGGTVVNCGGAAGELPPGDCSVQWWVFANQPGLVPGQATFVLQLLRYDSGTDITSELDTRTARVRLVNP